MTRRCVPTVLAVAVAVAVLPGVYGLCPALAAPARPSSRADSAPGGRPVSTLNDRSPTSAGGFTLRPHRVGFTLQSGWPFTGLVIAVGLNEWLTAAVGYRGIPSWTHAGFARFKARVHRSADGGLGVAMGLTAGYTVDNTPFDGGRPKGLVGGDRFFAELGLLATARRGRHGLLLGLGMRFSQHRFCEGHWLYARVCGGSDWGLPMAEPFEWFMATVWTEIGYELRIGPRASFFVALGIDTYINSDLMSIFPRLRLGFVLEAGR